MNENSQARSHPIGISIAAAIVLVAAFLPWGEIHGSPSTPFGGSMFGGMQMTLTMTGWNGNANLAGLKLPNWLVVLAAAGACGAAWLKAQSIADAPRALPVALAAYGLAHSCFMIVTLAGSSNATLGIGAIVTAGAFGWMLVEFVKGGARQKRYAE